MRLARRHIEDGLSVLYGIMPPLPTQTRFSFAGDVQNIQWGMIPRIFGRSYAIEADLVVPEQGAEGVIVAMADLIGGFGLWVDDHGILKHTHSLLGVDTYKQAAASKLPIGDVRVKMLFESKENEPGSGGHVTLFVNDEMVGGGDIPQTVPITFTSYSGMDIGRDNGLVVDLDYEDRVPYAFTGTVKKVVFDLRPAAHEKRRFCTFTTSTRWSPRASPVDDRPPQRPQVSCQPHDVPTGRHR
jgi:hypothetical protein